MWSPSGPEFVGSSPLRVACPRPSCRSIVAEPCTRLGPRRGRIRVCPHKERIELAEHTAQAGTATGG